MAIVTGVYAIRLPELGGLTDGLFTQPSLTLLLAVIMLVGGVTIIGVHRNWRGPVAVAISLFGWFVALRGLLLFAAPDLVRSGADAALLSPSAVTVARVGFAFLAVVGLGLTYAGWFRGQDQEGAEELRP
jgi:drug/metabolite transporter (DMT)-like permease